MGTKTVHKWVQALLADHGLRSSRSGSSYYSHSWRPQRQAKDSRSTLAILTAASSSLHSPSLHSPSLPPSVIPGGVHSQRPFSHQPFLILLFPFLPFLPSATPLASLLKETLWTEG